MKEAVVLYTGLGLSHLIPMAALANRFLNHGLSATVVTFNDPLKPGKANEDVSRLSSTSSNSTISFHVLPPVSLDDGYENLEPLTLTRATVAAQNVNLHEFLMDLSKTRFIRAIVLDLFCSLALDVASQLSIPAYFFMTFGASASAFFLHLVELDASSNLSLKDFGENPTNFPGLPPVLASDLPSFLLDCTSDSYKSFVKIFVSLVKSNGILMNTFASLEPKAISALREGLCVPSFNMPPFYSIGPLVTESQETEIERHECLKWLDLQPKGTVIFLCFGSMRGFPPDQIKQIATGLENSGQRFLWVVKVAMDPKMMFYNLMSEFELDQVLPEGFLNRTKDRGMVVKSWAPQIQVLNHKSVGGFMTHCGWNSILEAVTTGKPMLCWPLYAEQRLNKEILVNELRLGMTIEGYDQDMVGADEIEAKVRWLMEDEGGRLLQERSKAMKDKAAESLTEVGPSSQDFMQFLKDLEK